MRPNPSSGRALPLLLLALLLCAAAALALLFLPDGHASDLARAAPRAGLTEPAARDAAPAPDAPNAPGLVAARPETSRSEVHPAPEPEALPLTASNAFTVLVVWEDDVPIDEAEVELRSPEAVESRAVTDERGKTVFSKVPESVTTVRVSWADWILAEEAVPNDRGTLRIEVPLGNRVTGTVRVAGEAPSESILLFLDTRGGRVGVGPVPQTSDSGSIGTWRTLAGTKTDATGRFVFSGLSSDWQGELSLPFGYRFADEIEALVLDRPTEDLILDVIPPTTARGRILDPDGNPVPNQDFGYALSSRNSTTHRSAWTDEGGRFSIALGENTDKFQLRVDVAHVGTLRLEREVSPRMGLELGDLFLRAVRSVRFRVTDPDGNPIQGARARLQQVDSDPSGADGICALDSVPREAVRIEVYAPGYISSELDVAEAAAEEAFPIPVILDPAACLEVHIVGADGAGLANMTLVVTGEPVFDPRENGSPPAQPSSGGSYLRGWTSNGMNGIKEAEFAVGVGGVVSASGLSPGIPLHVSVLDPSENPTPWERTVVLETGERKTLEARIAVGMHALEGRVLDPNGEPVAGASVELPGKNFRTVKTAEDGSFHIAPLALPTAPLKVVSREYAPFCLPEAPTDTPIQVRLEKGHAHDVRVLDIDGSPARPEVVSARVGSIYVDQATLLEAGLYHFANLPSEGVEFVALWEDRTLSRPESPGGETVLQIPAPGRLVVQWNPAVEPGQRAGVVLERPAPDIDWLAKEYGPEEFDSGQAILESIKPGTWTLHAYITDASRTSGSEVATKTVEIRSRETTTVELP